MTDRELMQAILEAMEDLHRTGDTQVFDLYAAPEIIPALRERLSRPEQEPVAWVSAVTGDLTMRDMSHTVSWAPLCKCTTPPAAQRTEQEPVLEVEINASPHGGMGSALVWSHTLEPGNHKLYTAPPAAQPAAWESEMRSELAKLGFEGQCPESIGITIKRWFDAYAGALTARPAVQPKGDT